jgi:hypothetical protein
MRGFPRSRSVVAVTLALAVVALVLVSGVALVVADVLGRVLASRGTA